MPLFAKSQAQKFTPTAIKFSQLYKTGTQGGKPGTSVLSQAKEALSKAGYDDKKVSQIVTGDQKISTSEMKKVATIMNRARVYGFQSSPEYLVKKFLTKERVKGQNIARIRREQIMEAGQEDLGSYGTVSLNPRGQSPNSSAPNPLSRNRTASRPGSSLSSNSRTASSLSANARTASIGLGQGSGKSSFKPKF